MRTSTQSLASLYNTIFFNIINNMFFIMEIRTEAFNITPNSRHCVTYEILFRIYNFYIVKLNGFQSKYVKHQVLYLVKTNGKLCRVGKKKVSELYSVFYENKTSLHLEFLIS